MSNTKKKGKFLNFKGMRIEERLRKAFNIIIAIASIGNSPLAEFAAPPVTSCDPSFAEHLRAAFDLLEYNYNHPDALETSRLIQPEIIIRKSTDFTSKGEEK